jgi:hypothetical protein
MENGNPNTTPLLIRVAILPILGRTMQLHPSANIAFGDGLLSKIADLSFALGRSGHGGRADA